MSTKPAFPRRPHPPGAKKNGSISSLNIASPRPYLLTLPADSLPAKHGVQDDSEAPYVNGFPLVLLALNNFRSHVAGGAWKHLYAEKRREHECSWFVVPFIGSGKNILKSEPSFKPPSS